MKKLLAFILLICIVFSLWGCHNSDCDVEEGDIQVNGESYHYFVHSPQDGYDFLGAQAHTASFEQITNRLDTDHIQIPDCGAISSARAAAYYGAIALQWRTPNWNSSDMIGLVYNETANLWLVHGLFQDRNDPGEAWTVALDAETGKVLGFAPVQDTT